MGFTFPVRLTSIETYLRVAHGKDRPLSAAEVALLSEYADRILIDIEDEWPVDTATSVDSFSTTLHTQRGYIGFDIENDASYAQYVHRKGGTPEAPLYLDLIPNVIGQYQSRLLADLRAAIDRTEAEAKRRNTPPPPAFWARRPGA